MHGLLTYLFIYTGIFIKCLHPFSGISSIETIRIINIFSKWSDFEFALWPCDTVGSAVDSCLHLSEADGDSTAERAESLWDGLYRPDYVPVP